MEEKKSLTSEEVNCQETISMLHERSWPHEAINSLPWRTSNFKKKKKYLCIIKKSLIQVTQEISKKKL